MQNIDGFIFQYANKQTDRTIEDKINKRKCNTKLKNTKLTNKQDGGLEFEFWFKDGTKQKRKIKEVDKIKNVKTDIPFQYTKIENKEKEIITNKNKKEIKREIKSNDNKKGIINIKNKKEIKEVIKPQEDKKEKEVLVNDVIIKYKDNIKDNLIKKISPLNYHEIIEENENIEDKIIELINYSVDFIAGRENDKEIKKIGNIVKNKIKKINLKREAKEEELDNEIKEIKEEIKKWNEVSEEVKNKNIIKLKTFDMPELKDIKEFKDFKYKKNQIAYATSLVRKYVKTAKIKCEELFKKMFSFICSENADPILLLEALSKLKIN